MASWTLIPTLAGLALTLAGCGGGGGGGGGGKVNNNPPDLVSQTLKGQFQANVNVKGMDLKQQGKVTTFFDVDGMNLRFDISDTVNGGMTVEASAILNGTGELTLNVGKAIAPFAGCKTMNLSKKLNISLQDLKEAIKLKMKQQKPEGMDGDLRKFSMKIPEEQGMSGNVSGEFDDDNVLHKASMSVKGTAKGISAAMDMTFDFDQAKGGSPDPSSFKVPAEWLPCKPAGSAEGEALAPVLAALLRELPREAPRAAVVV